MTEVWPPVLVNADSARGTGQIPDKEDQMYVVDRDELYLIPTAEVPVTNLHRDEILDAGALPIRYAAYSASFRREAGAAGRDTRGILRVHQFDKVEMVSFTRPDESPNELEWLTSCAERLLQDLGLAYRVLLMSTREMGFVQARKYDLEVWAPAIERWLEVSSVSNFRDYQARRMAIRFRPEAGATPELVHTLNGSGLALPRNVAALLETHQQDRRLGASCATRFGPRTSGVALLSGSVSRRRWRSWITAWPRPRAMKPAASRGTRSPTRLASAMARLPQKAPLSRDGTDRPGNEEQISAVADLHDGDRDRVGPERQTERRPQRDP